MKDKLTIFQHQLNVKKILMIKETDRVEIDAFKMHYLEKNLFLSQ
jgi:hypothetical protein